VYIDSGAYVFKKSVDICILQTECINCLNFGVSIEI
jgi:hypothetical protein